MVQNSFCRCSHFSPHVVYNSTSHSPVQHSFEYSHNNKTTTNHVCPSCKESHQAQEACRAPNLRCHDCSRHCWTQGQNWILQTGHPQVHLCQLQGGCCQGYRPSETCSQVRHCQGISQDGQGVWQGSRMLQTG